MAIIKKLIFVPFFVKKKGLQEKKNIYLIIDLSIDEWNVAFFCVYIFFLFFSSPSSHLWSRMEIFCNNFYIMDKLDRSTNTQIYILKATDLQLN